MADMTLAVKITGDASSLSSAVNEAQGKIGQLKKSINDASATNGIDAIGSQVQKVGDKISSFGKSYTAKVTTPIVAGSAVAVKKFAEVDKTMQLTNATMGNSAADAEKLEKAMKNAASNSTFGMNDAAQASLNFARAGLDAAEAAESLAPAMNLAAGEGGNLDTVSAGLVATINGFGGSFDEAGKYADVFANACNNSALDVDSLSQAMSIAAPIFSSAGYEVNDAALYMGVMANKGIEANKAANSLKTGMARLVDPSKEGAAWMEKLGVSVKNADGSMKDSVQVQKELHDAFAGLSESEQIAAASAIFGKNQMAPWLALINTAPDEVDNLSNSLEKEGTTAEMADAMMSGFGGSLEKIKSSIDVAATSFGEALAPSIEKVADKIQSAVDWFNNLDPAQQQAIAKAALLVAAIGPVLLVIGKLTTSVGGLMTTFGTAGGSITTMLGPLGKIAGIAGLVIAAFIGMYQNSETFRNAVDTLVSTALASLKEIFEALKPVFEAVFEALKPLLGALGDMLAPMIELIAQQIELATPLIVGLAEAFAWVVEKITPLIEWIGQLISLLGEGFSVVLEAISEKISAVVEWFSGFGDAAASLRDTVSNAWETIQNVVEVAVMAIGSILEAAFEIITLPFRLIWENCKEYVFTAWEAIKTTVSNALQPIKDKITEAWNTIKETTSRVWYEIKTKAGEVWQQIHDAVAEPTNKAKEKISSVWRDAKSTISGHWNSLKDSAGRIWDGIKDKITGPIDKAKDSIGRAWDKVTDILETKIHIPHIDLPHFNINGSFSLDPPSVPHLDVDWYAKGGIVNKASVVGVGEAGPEAITPIDKLKAYVTEAVTNARSAQMDYTAVDSLADAITAGFAMQSAPTQGGEYRFIVELGGARVAEKIYTLNKEGQMIMQGA